MCVQEKHTHESDTTSSHNLTSPYGWTAHAHSCSWYPRRGLCPYAQSCMMPNDALLEWLEAVSLSRKSGRVGGVGKCVARVGQPIMQGGWKVRAGHLVDVRLLGIRLGTNMQSHYFGCIQAPIVPPLPSFERRGGTCRHVHPFL